MSIRQSPIMKNGIGTANISLRTQAYHTVMQQLQAGKIKDAYALRDALNAALKQFSKPPK